jgi:hypothetical protein
MKKVHSSEDNQKDPEQRLEPDAKKTMESLSLPVMKLTPDPWALDKEVERRPLYDASDVLLIVDAEGSVRLNRVGADCKCVEMLRIPGDFQDARILNSGDRLITIDRTGQVALYQLRHNQQPQQLWTFKLPGPHVKDFALSSDDNRMAITDSSGFLRLYKLHKHDLSRPKLIDTGARKKWYCRAAFIPDSHNLATLSYQFLMGKVGTRHICLECLNASGHHLIHDFGRIPFGSVHSELALSSDGQTLAVMFDHDRVIQLIKATLTASHPRELRYRRVIPPQRTPSSIAFAREDPRTLQIATQSGIIRLPIDAIEYAPGCVQTHSQLRVSISSIQGRLIGLTLNGTGDKLAASDLRQVIVAGIGGLDSVNAGGRSTVHFAPNPDAVHTALSAEQKDDWRFLLQNQMSNLSEVLLAEEYFSPRPRKIFY